MANRQAVNPQADIDKFLDDHMGSMDERIKKATENPPPPYELIKTEEAAREVYNNTQLVQWILHHAREFASEHIKIDRDDPLHEFETSKRRRTETEGTSAIVNNMTESKSERVRQINQQMLASGDYDGSFIGLFIKYHPLNLHKLEMSPENVKSSLTEDFRKCFENNGVAWSHSDAFGNDAVKNIQSKQTKLIKFIGESFEEIENQGKQISLANSNNAMFRVDKSDEWYLAAEQLTKFLVKCGRTKISYDRCEKAFDESIAIALQTYKVQVGEVQFWIQLLNYMMDPGKCPMSDQTTAETSVPVNTPQNTTSGGKQFKNLLLPNAKGFQNNNNNNSNNNKNFPKNGSKGQSLFPTPDQK